MNAFTEQMTRGGLSRTLLRGLVFAIALTAALALVAGLIGALGGQRYWVSIQAGDYRPVLALGLGVAIMGKATIDLLVDWKDGERVFTRDSLLAYFAKPRKLLALAAAVALFGWVAFSK